MVKIKKVILVLLLFVSCNTFAADMWSTTEKDNETNFKVVHVNKGKEYVKWDPVPWIMVCGAVGVGIISLAMGTKEK